MKTVNSLSGGKTSSYIAANYPADYDVFALVRIEHEASKFADKKIRQEVEDRIQAPFIATAEDDMIIYTMLDLEQYIGRKITWVTGKTFDDSIRKWKNGDLFLPSYMRRYCTTDMKVEPIAKWINDKLDTTPKMRIGFRSNEHSRAKKMIERQNQEGFIEVKIRVGKHKNGNNKWKKVNYCQPEFPLIKDGIFKDHIEQFWKDKPVRFAWMNNCVGCFHKENILLKKMWNKHPSKLEWFALKERESQNKATWKENVTYDQIKNWNVQQELFEDDFNECDSGYCGI